LREGKRNSPDALVHGVVGERVKQSDGHVEAVHRGPRDHVRLGGGGGRGRGDGGGGRRRPAAVLGIPASDGLELRAGAVVGDLKTPQLDPLVHRIVTERAVRSKSKSLWSVVPFELLSTFVNASGSVGATSPLYR
jgi:hypothetical protein